MKTWISASRSSLVALALLLLVAGCGAPVRPTASLSKTTPSPSHTPVVSLSPPKLTSFPTITTSPTSTTGPLPTPTWVALPTLQPDQAQALVLDLLENNTGCQLPCWWGFTPGQTSWQTAQSFLNTFASRISGGGSFKLSSYTVKIDVPEDVQPGAKLVQEYTVRNGIIEMIATDAGDSFRYTLPELLTSHGQPAEVWIRTFKETPGSTLPFHLVLVYSQQGIMAHYYDTAEKKDDQLQGCPQGSGYRPLLWLWSSDQKMTFMEAAKKAVRFGLDEAQYYRPLEEATGMAIETFYQTFKDPTNTTCLETPSEMW